MPTPEGAVKNWVKTRILKQYPTAYIYITHQGPYGKRGVADLVCCIQGLFVAVEVKTIKGKLTALQELEGRRVEKSGGIWVAIYGRNEDAMIDLFDNIEDVLSITRG